MQKQLSRTEPAHVGDFPLLYAADGEFNLPDWLAANRRQVEEELMRFGAILFRGFPLDSADDFNLAFQSIFGDPMEYTFRTSPREEVGKKIYTSTTHPADQVIHFHTENSYSKTWNRIISFFCLVPPGEGGETPIADERRIIHAISPRLVDRFAEKGIRYMRNTLPGIGLDWRTIYQTNDKTVVNGYLEKNEMEFEWVASDHLRTTWTLPAFHNHPVSGEKVWFNHMYFGHPSLYDPDVVDFIGEENLPFATFYGDGSAIGTEVIEEFNRAYNQHKIVFKWEKGDLLIMDNMLFSHGRNPFKGDRKILVAMAAVVDYANN
jgi:alpha-ketoglutarate-dependent taurine dioxygenase